MVGCKPRGEACVSQVWSLVVAFCRPPWASPLRYDLRGCGRIKPRSGGVPSVDPRLNAHDPFRAERRVGETRIVVAAARQTTAPGKCVADRHLERFGPPEEFFKKLSLSAKTAPGCIGGDPHDGVVGRLMYPPSRLRYGLRAPGYGLRGPGYGLRAPGYGLRAPGYGLRAPGYGLLATRPGFCLSMWVRCGGATRGPCALWLTG